jgi:osmotically inducible protein OsmC
MPSFTRAVAQALLDEAHRMCPDSKATRGSIDVTITLV